MPLSTQTKVVLVGGIPALGVAWLLHRYSDGKPVAPPPPPRRPLFRDPSLGFPTEQWASRQAANSMASAPSSLLSRGQLKAFSAMDDLAGDQQARYAQLHPGSHPPFFTPTPDEPKAPEPMAALPAAAAAAPPVPTAAPSVPPAAPSAPPASAALVRGLLQKDKAAAPPRVHHKYPLPSGLTVHDALDVLVRDVARHAAFVVRRRPGAPPAHGGCPFAHPPPPRPPPAQRGAFAPL